MENVNLPRALNNK